MQKFELVVTRKIPMSAPDDIGHIQHDPEPHQDGRVPILSMECERFFEWCLYEDGSVTAGCRNWANIEVAREHYTVEKYIKNAVPVGFCGDTGCSDCKKAKAEEQAERRDTRKLALKRLNFLERVYKKWRNS